MQRSNTPAPAGKPYRELCELESGIQEQLDSGTAADPEYWQVRDFLDSGCVPVAVGASRQFSLHQLQRAAQHPTHLAARLHTALLPE